MTAKKKAPGKSLKEKALDLLYPARLAVDEKELGAVGLPGSATSYFNGYPASAASDPAQAVFSASSEDEKLLHELPSERFAKYSILEAMSCDPTIDSAIKMHIAHALSAADDTGEVLAIESTTDTEDPIVNDLRDTFKSVLDDRIQGWAYIAAQLGVNYVRVYGEPGKGVTNLRGDYYDHPRFVREFRQAGQPAGYTSAYQEGNNIRLMPPWAFVAFRIPYWRSKLGPEPYRVNTAPLDLSSGNYGSESLSETQDYGSSLIETAYSPWSDLQDAVLSVNMSRKNAARLERLIGVNTGKLDPVRAAKYLNTISNQIKKTDRARAESSLRHGFIQTVLNHIIPIFGDSKGRLDINSIEGSPNIEGLEDVMFHVKRLGSALGIDPALLGFGEMMSGGLGDGGFFRISIIAAVKAQMLRKAIKTGLERLFEIHIAYKYGKVFLPGQKPWRLMFNSVSTALEREERENREGRANLSLTLAGLFQTMDPEGSVSDPRAVMNFLCTDVLRIDEEKFKGMFPEGKAKKAEGAEGEEEGGLFESAKKNKDDLKAMVYEAMGSFYKEA